MGMLFAALPSVAQQQPIGATSLKNQSRVEGKSNADPNVEVAGSSKSNDQLFYGSTELPDLENSGQLTPPVVTENSVRAENTGGQA